MFCHGEHTFTVSKQVFFDRRIVSFACPNTGMDVLFVGGLEEVEKALDENEKEIVRILKESGIDGYESFASVFGIDPDEDFEQSFSAYREFDSNLMPQQVEGTLCEEIIEEIVDQIYNATVANW